MINDIMSISEYISNAAQELGVTKTDILLEAGMHPTTYTKWATGTSPTFNNVMKIARAVESLRKRNRTGSVSPPAMGAVKHGVRPALKNR